MPLTADVQSALETRLSGTPSLPPVAWPNTNYNPILGTTFIRPTIFYTDTTTDTLSGQHSLNGFYQIDVFVKANSGSKILNQWISTLYNRYNNQALTTPSGVVYIKNISPSSPRRDESWYTAYVEINFTCTNN